ncbi:hypothetical protein [Burkholderia glumae]|uniref:Uncharacterized protein n=1 Tax=Burkholderia glumae TaxID=337 RepID=A0AAQ0BUL8_BURGL|nr:hypothetical protein [Burkholderia glumae]AJY65068.1 hypothetical protein KS03_3014 [Burkholderia glumae LMG 2196 = ATCC 33617]MCM2493558.1 hypothetical protein [Burkholderia glumae]MCM2537893.1 hypothetical protein [Burkholderia glumae]MCM2543819.1 hypothetical protein [Burkholderia glumae]MCM2547533.1 hypothetical protein [Burkholderia glumae]
MSAHWVMLGLAAVVGLMGVVGARDLLRGGLQQRLVPVRVRQPARRTPRD